MPDFRNERETKVLLLTTLVKAENTNFDIRASSERTMKKVALSKTNYTYIYIYR